MMISRSENINLAKVKENCKASNYILWCTYVLKYLIKIMFTKVCRSYHSTLAKQTFHQTKSFIEN